MRKYVQFKGILMICLVFALVTLHVKYFQNTNGSAISLIIIIALLFIAAYWIGNNTSSKQFERIMKGVGGENILYILDDIAAVDTDNQLIYYSLKKNRYDWFWETNNNMLISCFCALPIGMSAQEIFHVIKKDLDEIMNPKGARCTDYECKQYSFYVEFELQSKDVSVEVLRQIQESLVSILIDKYQLNAVKRYLKTIEAEDDTIYYWEFTGYNVTRFVRYNVQRQLLGYDDEDVPHALSDITSNAVILTEKEFETVYNQAVDRL